MGIGGRGMDVTAWVVFLLVVVTGMIVHSHWWR